MAGDGRRTTDVYRKHFRGPWSVVGVRCPASANQPLPEEQHRQGEQRRQGDRPQRLPPGHNRPEANGQPGGGEQGYRPAERPPRPGIGRGDHQQAKIDRSQARGEDNRPRPGHDQRRGVVVERLAAVANGEVDVARAVDDRPGRQAMVGLVMGHAGRRGREGNHSEGRRRQEDERYPAQLPEPARCRIVGPD